MKFIVGDIVVGNARADEEYSITKTGVMCEVVDIDMSTIRVKVCDGSDRRYWVEQEYFDLVQPCRDEDEDNDYASFISGFGVTI